MRFIRAMESCEIVLTMFEAFRYRIRVTISAHRHHHHHAHGASAGVFG
jgi:hypothetical protein